MASALEQFVNNVRTLSAQGNVKVAEYAYENMACITSNYDLYDQNLIGSVAFSFLYVTGRKFVMWH
jgi:hypothetical protein